MTAVELHHGAATDVGVVREVNEDAFLAEPPVFVVADGMGGHDRGDVASRIVVEEFARLADKGYDPQRGADVIATTLRSCQARIGEYDARAAGPRRPRLPGRHHRGGGAADRAERRAEVAARQRRRLPDLPLQPR